MNQQSQVIENVGAAIGMFPLAEDENTYNFTDLEKELFVSVEFAETRVGTWVWSCQAIVGDLTERSLSPMILLQLNDSGLTWCYYAVYRYAGGYSLNLKYAFAHLLAIPRSPRKL
jgi:hypothetical protein